MDPGDAFSANFLRWDPRGTAAPPCSEVVTMALVSSQPQHHPQQPHEPSPSPATAAEIARAAARDLEDVFDGYGVRYATVARIGQLGFTASTLVGMREEEVDDMMTTLTHLFRWDLLVGERYGIKAAVRAERRRLEALVFPPNGCPSQHHQGHLLSSAAGATGLHYPLSADDPRRRLMLLSPDHPNALDALSQEGLSEEPVQLDREAAGSGGEAVGMRDGKGKSSLRKKKDIAAARKSRKKKKKGADQEDDGEEEERWRFAGDDEDDDDAEGSESSERGVSGERQREHPFIVTEPGEVARAKKNGLDYLFHLYEQCHEFLLQVQALAKERGDKCPTKVTNQVFRYAKKVGASYINKPKMRHYVHCYALHVLDEGASDALRRSFKERGENVGAWRQACYKPLVAISAAHAFDVDAVFNAHPRLSIWYVPTRLRHLCHLARSATASSLPAACPGGSATSQHAAGLPDAGHGLRRPMF
ncbi:Floricaula/leafy like [Apostasia shenzhenica]|uniref:Floricaula/leafy-like transcription factor n=1 Tax=Apostasia shenzhenica TaxID=1088818 RepID=A0A2I0AW14_9ASPA|nr:Floricaula/leafy like [Apostasia shenzhenica]